LRAARSFSNDDHAQDIRAAGWLEDDFTEPKAAQKLASRKAYDSKRRETKRQEAVGLPPWLQGPFLETPQVVYKKHSNPLLYIGGSPDPVKTIQTCYLERKQKRMRRRWKRAGMTSLKLDAHKKQKETIATCTRVGRTIPWLSSRKAYDFEKRKFKRQEPNGLRSNLPIRICFRSVI
jgi:hypothetical protein